MKLPVLLVVSALTAALSTQLPSSTPLGQLLDHVRAGSSAEAVDAFSKWPDDRVLTEAAVPPDPENITQIGALLLLHLETGIRKRTLGDAAPNSTNDIVREVHFRLSEPLLARVAEFGLQRKDAAALEFCRDWWIVGLSHQARRVVLSRAMDPPLALLRAHPRFNDHPDVALARGTVEESLIGPESDGPFGSIINSWAISTPNGNFDGVFVQGAEREYRRAIRDDPGQAEAQLRLGRLLFLVNRKREAESELSAAVKRAGNRDPFVAYLAHLFQARLAETEGQVNSAISGYRAAIAVLPTAWTARIGLSQALIMNGREAEGWAIARSVLEDNDVVPDPWSFYNASLYHQNADRLARMRTWVAGRPVPAAQRSAIAAPTAAPAPSPVLLPEPTPAAGHRFSSTTDGVRLDVRVLDAGKPVTGLSSDDFDVVDQGVRQTVVSAQSVSGVSIALVIDTSESVDRPEYWTLVRRSADAVASALRSGDDVSVVAADDRPVLVLRSSRDLNRVRTAVADLRPRDDSRTALWDAVLTATSLGVDRDVWPLVFVVSDGADNVSWFDRSRIFPHLQRTGVMVDAIDTISTFLYKHTTYVPPDLMASQGSWTMEGVKRSGGVLFRAVEGDLNEAVAARLDDLRKGYIVTYQPRGGSDDKGWRNVTVRLKNGKRGTVTTRPGYYVGKSRR
jgi:VWFA-related protein